MSKGLCYSTDARKNDYQENLVQERHPFTCLKFFYFKMSVKITFQFPCKESLFFLQLSFPLYSKKS